MRWKSLARNISCVGGGDGSRDGRRKGTEIQVAVIFKLQVCARAGVASRGVRGGDGSRDGRRKGTEIQVAVIF